MRVQRQQGKEGRGAGFMRGEGDLTQPPSYFSKFLVFLRNALNAVCKTYMYIGRSFMATNIFLAVDGFLIKPCLKVVRFRIKCSIPRRGNFIVLLLVSLFSTSFLPSVELIIFKN